MAVVQGLATVSSPWENPMSTCLAGTPASGSFRKCGAYADGSSDIPTHSVRSKNSWIPIAPATVLMTGGWFRSGIFSLKNGPGTGTPPMLVRPGELMSEGTRDCNTAPVVERGEGSPGKAPATDSAPKSCSP